MVEPTCGVLEAPVQVAVVVEIVQLAVASMPAKVLAEAESKFPFARILKFAAELSDARRRLAALLEPASKLPTSAALALFPPAVR